MKNTGKGKGNKVTLIAKKTRNSRARVTNLWKKTKSNQ
jgi:hypothetical protein